MDICCLYVETRKNRGWEDKTCTISAREPSILEAVLFYLRTGSPAYVLVLLLLATKTREAKRPPHTMAPLCLSSTPRRDLGHRDSPPADSPPPTSQVPISAPVRSIHLGCLQFSVRLPRSDEIRSILYHLMGVTSSPLSNCFSTDKLYDAPRAFSPENNKLSAAIT